MRSVWDLDEIWRDMRKIRFGAKCKPFAAFHACLCPPSVVMGERSMITGTFESSSGRNLAMWSVSLEQPSEETTIEL